MKIFFFLAALTTISISYSAEEWWQLDSKFNCAPAALSPSEIMRRFPGCKIMVYNKDTGVLLLNCKETELNNIFLYGETLRGCMQSGELLKKK